MSFLNPVTGTIVNGNEKPQIRERKDPEKGIIMKKKKVEEISMTGFEPGMWSLQSEDTNHYAIFRTKIPS